MLLVLKKLFGSLPWILLVILLSWIIIEDKFSSEDADVKNEINQSTLLGKVTQLGKIELIQYNFQEVTELKKITELIDYKIFKYKPAPDSKAVLISTGTATGCLDLTSISAENIWHKNDTIHIELPQPELCYFKVDLEKSRLYDLEIDYLSKDEQAKFMEKLYAEAERNIKNSALQMGILDQTKINAQAILNPLFTTITNKPIVCHFDLSSEEVQLNF